MKKQTISQILNSCRKGDRLTDGVRWWKVVYSATSEADCAIAIPMKKKWGSTPRFELWADAQSDVSYLPNLRKV